jgi:hypothetical protein
MKPLDIIDTAQPVKPLDTTAITQRQLDNDIVIHESIYSFKAFYENL